MAAPEAHGRHGLGELAHDLRSALAATTAYLDLARERLADGERVEDADLARVEQGLQRMAALVADIEAAAPRRAAREGPR